jgi:hypothetical protein
MVTAEVSFLAHKYIPGTPFPEAEVREPVMVKRCDMSLTSGLPLNPPLAMEVEGSRKRMFLSTQKISANNTIIFKIQPDHFDGVHLLGVAAAQNNQYDKAAALLRRLIRFN